MRKFSRSCLSTAITIFALTAIALLPERVSADAKVDGFFPEDFVTKGVFKENIEQDAQASRRGFFISRSERRAHPERAVSNQIKPARRKVIMVSSPYRYRFPRYPIISLPPIQTSSFPPINEWDIRSLD